MKGWGTLVLAAALTASPAAASTPDPSFNTQQYRHTCDNYPPAAIRDNAEGSTVVSLHVDARGNVSEVMVAESSGNKDLDDAATACVQAWHYDPSGLDQYGTTKKIRILWHLNDSPPQLPLADLTKHEAPEPNHLSFDEPPEALPDGVEIAGDPHACTRWYPSRAIREKKQGVTGLTYTITPEGTVKDIEVEQSSGDERLDQVSIICASFWRYKFTGAKREIAWRTAINWKLTP